VDIICILMYRIVYLLYDFIIAVFLGCFVVQDSPRLGSLSEIYAEIIISAHGYPNGVLQLSNATVHVPDGYVGPLLYVVRTDGLLGQVRFISFLFSDSTLLVLYDDS